MSVRRLNKRNRKTAEFFAGERDKFIAISRHASLISNRIGRHVATPNRGYATWLFMRATVTARSIERLLEPHQSEFSDIKYLDQASIASLCRALIETIVVTFYIGNIDIPDDEWWCRKWIIDVHDYVNRKIILTFFTSDGHIPINFGELEKRLKSNSYFLSLPASRQKQLLDGKDMFIEGRHNAMLALGWGDETTRAVYKYLSLQTHSLSMSFHRTELNGLYQPDSAYAKAVAAFSLPWARLAIGSGAMHMVRLFPYVEAVFDPIIFSGLKKDYDSHEIEKPLAGAF